LKNEKFTVNMHLRSQHTNASNTGFRFERKMPFSFSTTHINTDIGLALSTLIKMQFLFTSDELFWRDVVQFAGQGQYVIFSI